MVVETKRKLKTPKPVLKEDRIYLGDNGRSFCGTLRHAGMTAFYTGHDISGQTVLELTAEEIRQEGIKCETCSSL